MASFSVFDFTNIAGYPNQMVKFKDIREFPVFSRTYAISVAKPLDGMERCFMITDTSHLDVMFKDFASYLTHDASEWFKSLPAGTIATYDDLKKKFFDRWPEKKELVLTNNALMTI